MSLDPELESIRRRLFRDVDRVAEALDGLDDEQIAWKPLEQACSLIVLVTHVVGSAENTVLQLAGEESLRDRDTEFLAPWTARSVQGEVAAAKGRISAALERVDPVTLGTKHAAPRISVGPLTVPAVSTLSAGATTARDFLLQTIAHTAEHAGHAELTRDLVRGRGASPRESAHLQA
jgi:hypothetical protein